MIDVDILSVDEAKSEFSSIQALFPSFDDVDIAKVVSMVTGICGHCYEESTPCCCTWDE